MELVSLKSFSDERGKLTVVEKCLPFEVKRIFFLHEIKPNQTRGGHGHKWSKIGILSTSGSFKIKVKNGIKEEFFLLNAFESVLVLNPEDWHLLFDFSVGAVACVFSSHFYDVNDYFFEEPI